MIKLIITLAILALPLLISLAEQKNRRKKAMEAMKNVRDRQDQGPPEPAAPKQSLGDWIEEISNKQDLAANMDPGHVGRRRAAPDPLDDPAVDEIWEWADDESSGHEVLPKKRPHRPNKHSILNLPLVDTPTVPPALVDRDQASQAAHASSAKRARRAHRAHREGQSASLTPDDLRRGIILKELLDKPLSLRERG